jgi:trans-feruloyl-CoA hydratase/vanillin synthase
MIHNSYGIIPLNWVGMATYDSPQAAGSSMTRNWMRREGVLMDECKYEHRWQTVHAEVENRIGWAVLNRPEKRNAMSPTLNCEMQELLDAFELDDSVGVVVLTGAGEAWSAGMDLKEYFRAMDDSPEIVQDRIRRDASAWQWRILRMYAKPTIAMVNGWCFGGAFTPLVACDLAIASETAVFGLSEINWGIPPGNLVSRALGDVMGYRKALEYIMTGKTFTGAEAAEMGVVNKAVPAERLREETIALANSLLEKNPTALRAAKNGFKRCCEFTWEQSEDYLYAKLDQALLRDPEGGREKGLQQFLDEKSIKPGLQAYKR